MENAKSFKELNKFKVVDLKVYCKKIKVKPKRLKKDIINQILEFKEENIIDDALEPEFENIIDDALEPEFENIIEDALDKLKKELEFYKNKVIEIEKKIKEFKKPKLKVIDLFCGCGGMSKGLENAGLDIICGIDIWDKAINSYNKNFNHLSICEDIKELSPLYFDNKYKIGKNNIDLIVGGPPCQGFSIAGKRDIKDPRNSLFMEYVKYLDYFNPKTFIMENVMGILSMKNSSKINVIDIIMEQLNKNYNCIICKLYASDFEVPQNRRRVIIIGIRKDLNKYPTEPSNILSKENRIPVSTILLSRDKIDEKNYLSEKAINGIIAKKLKSKQNGNGFGAQFLKLDKPSYTIPARYWKDGYDALVKYNDTDIRLSLIHI